MFVYDRNCGMAVGQVLGGDDSFAVGPLLAEEPDGPLPPHSLPFAPSKRPPETRHCDYTVHSAQSGRQRDGISRRIATAIRQRVRVRSPSRTADHVIVHADSGATNLVDQKSPRRDFKGQAVGHHRSQRSRQAHIRYQRARRAGADGYRAGRYARTIGRQGGGSWAWMNIAFVRAFLSV
jgi:hypothetical protein